MTCTNCGKNIPLNGNVCPYCHADKSGDQMLTVIMFVGGGVGGFIGNFFADWTGMFVGIVAGCIVGAVLGFKAKAQHERNSGGVPTQPNVVATLKQLQQQNAAPPPAAPSATLADADRNGGGNYRVVGVDKQTGMDTAWYTRAVSPANAKVKAELQGIIVTEVTRA